MVESGAQFEFCKNSKKSLRKKWTKRETINLIEMLEGRPYLWNIYEKCYHSRDTGERISRNFEGPRYVRGAVASWLVRSTPE